MKVYKFKIKKTLSYERENKMLKINGYNLDIKEASIEKIPYEDKIIVEFKDYLTFSKRIGDDYANK